MENTKKVEPASKTKRAPRQKLNINDAIENSTFLADMLVLETPADFIRDALRRTDELPPVKIMFSTPTREPDKRLDPEVPIWIRSLEGQKPRETGVIEHENIEII